MPPATRARIPTTRSSGLGSALGWLIGLPLMVLALAVAAWVLSNLSDAEPQPRPKELALPAAKVGDERNAAYALIGLRAAPDRDAAAAGRESWRLQLAHAARPATERSAQEEASRKQVEGALGPQLPILAGAPMQCDADAPTCQARWLAEAPALVKQRVGAAAFGKRCEAMLDGPFEFEELLPPKLDLDAPLMPWTNASACMNWLRTGATVSFAQGRREEAMTQLKRADKLQRQLLAGARSLVGAMVSLRVARLSLDSMAALAVRDAALAQSLAQSLEPALAEPLDTRPVARRVIAFESNFLHTMLGTVHGHCSAAFEATVVLDPQQVPTLIPTPIDALCRAGIGFHTERTRQRADAYWMQQWRALEYPWSGVLAGAMVQEKGQRERGPWRSLSWRNTLGELLVPGTLVGFTPYLARWADLELHRAAVAAVLAMQRERVAPAQRSAWLRTRPVTEAWRDRATLGADGAQLTLRTWQSEMTSVGFNAARDGIAISWPQ